jgi:hypothetical protein
MEYVEVSAHFDLQGRITPASFTWSGRSYKVDAVSRRWEDETGLHYLVMATGEQTFELVFLPAESRWQLQPLNPRWSYA